MSNLTCNIVHVSVTKRREINLMKCCHICWVDLQILTKKHYPIRSDLVFIVFSVFIKHCQHRIFWWSLLSCCWTIRCWNNTCCCWDKCSWREFSASGKKITSVYASKHQTWRGLILVFLPTAIKKIFQRHFLPQFDENNLID
jgi:hypothetical protein